MKNRSSFCKVSAGMLIFALSTPALLVGCSGPQPKTEGAIYDTGKVAEYATPYVSYDANYNTEEYNAIDESSFKAVATSPLSTFAADVDTASYANIRRFINSGELPPADAVRIEEMLNYFHYDYPQPNEGEPFSVTTEISACPWNPDTKLMMVGMQAKSMAELEKKPSNLVFLIDVSGSMEEPDKLPLVKNAFLLLCEQLMEALADNGNGNYSYIDSRFEAKKVLSEELGANFFTVAKDVKFQLEFNPKFIKGYRLIGYENRIMDDEDFKDDKKDGGEIGSGHRVTVLYEIVDNDSPMEIGSDLKYQTTAANDSNDLLNIAVRYKEPDSETSKELNYPVTTESIKTEMSDNMKFAAAVAETGMLLRDSEFKGKSSYDSVVSLLDSIPDIKNDTSKLEFLLLVKKMATLAKEQ